MPSFTRTIPAEKEPYDVKKILSRSDHYIPLTFRPGKAFPGDYIYLIFRGKIIGRALISSIDPVKKTEPNYPSWSKWVVRYQGDWEVPPGEILLQGHQGVRYLTTHQLEHLDRENWETYQQIVRERK